MPARVPAGAPIALEARASVHHWGRELQCRGYRVRLIAAQFVKPYAKSNKNDRVDAEAAGRPPMRFVAVKSVVQQDAQAIHRLRSELIKQRTAAVNQIRGLAGEYGLVAPARAPQLRRAIPCWLEEAENGLSERFRVELASLREGLQQLEERVAEQDEHIACQANEDPVAQRLLALRGVGPVIATALAGALGDGRVYARGRDFAASPGLTPRQHSAGGRDRLLGITKCGDPYLRKLLVHGARAVIRHAQGRDDGLCRWVNDLVARKHVSVATAALANKRARMARAIVHGGTEYDPALAAASPA